jgi:hypothetical protein
MSTEFDSWQEAAFQQAQDVAKLLISKQHDYGHGNINAFGELGVLVRASDKIERLKNLHKRRDTPSNESVDDTWMDLAGYAIIALMIRRGWFDLPLKEDDVNQVS